MKQHATRSRIAVIGLLSVVVILIAVSFSLYWVNQSNGFAQSNSPTEAMIAIALGSAPAPVVGVVVDTSMTVVTVEAGSAAEQAGIQVGDTVTEIDGVKVASAAELRLLTSIGLMREIQTPEVLNTTPGVQEALDTAAAANKQPEVNPALDVSLVIVRAGTTMVIDVTMQPQQVQPQKGNSVSTPTPVPQDSFYF